MILKTSHSREVFLFFYFLYMRSLDRDVRADTQLWGTHYIHAMNISDEIVTGQERL